MEIICNGMASVVMLYAVIISAALELEVNYFFMVEEADQSWILTRFVMAVLVEVEHPLALQHGEGEGTLDETSLVITWGLSLTLIDQRSGGGGSFVSDKTWNAVRGACGKGGDGYVTFLFLD